MSLGPVMMDLVGTEISSVERELLLHPLIGGVILFTRNFESISQISEVISQIHQLRTPHLLVAVDHEGGRVQRFHDGFTRLPPAAAYKDIYKQSEKRGRECTEAAGWLMAAELRAIGVDFSFAPVLDLAHGVSGVIGDRAFHSKPEIVATLAYAFMHGMLSAGMHAVGKHFPGHGGVAEDSHHALPVDSRSFDTILHQDLIPFERMIRNNLSAIMPAHVVYDQVDNKPAGYSQFWLQTVLRKRFNFQGVIFSDDLSMEAAGIAGSFPARAEAAMAAGCDMVLVCNHPEAVAEVIDELKDYSNPVSQLRLMRMHGKTMIPREALIESYRWKQASNMVEMLDENPWYEMDV